MIWYPRRLGTRVMRTVKGRPRFHRAARSVRFALGSRRAPRTLSGIPGRVHMNDSMLARASPEDIASYREGAMNVLALVDEALAAAHRSDDDVTSWLDFGCGYGRVIRLLAKRIPPHRITACDVVAEGVDFCASEFGVRPLHSRESLSSLVLGTYDFVYAISVLTHLDEENSEEFLHLLGDSVAPGGLFLFTTHGSHALEHPERYGVGYAERKAELAELVAKRGTAYLPYAFMPSSRYGMAWHSTEYVTVTMARLHGDRLRLLLHRPRALDGHQDVFVYRARDELAD